MFRSPIVVYFRNSQLILIALMAAATSIFGCGPSGQSANWLKNGLLDPTQSGNFEKPGRLEIRDSVSVLDEPLGIQDAEEPTEEDVIANFDVPKIGPGDFVRINVFELLAPGVGSEQQFQVRADGYETFPAFGPVRIAGYTPRELELEIKALLRDAGVLENADVQVTILRSESQQFSIIGGVTQPGNYPIPGPNYRLASALSSAGGIPPMAETIIVIRNGAKTAMDSPAMPQSQPAMPDTTPKPLGSLPVSYTMSDVSPNGGTSSAPATTEPAPPKQGVNELEILEGGPRDSGDGMMPVYNPQTGEWELAAPGSTTSEAPDKIVFPEGEVPPSNPTTTGMTPESEAFDPGAFTSNVRVLEIPAKALREGDPRYNIVVRPSDLIDVPFGEIGEFYMYGNVARPGAYQLTGRRITVKQAIASAGGFGPLAWPSRADLIRRVGKDEEQFIQIDLDAIFAGTAPDFYLRQNDIVNVGSTPVAVFLAVLRNAFRFSYGFGFVYDRNFADSDSFGAKEQTKQRRNLEKQQRGLPF